MTPADPPSSTKPMGLTFAEPGATPAVPRDSATVLPLREREGDLEIYCIQRSAKSSFLAGAVVFPGGKVDEADRDPRFAALIDEAHPRLAMLGGTGPGASGLLVAAMRELLEEAAILPTRNGLDAPATRALQRALGDGSSFNALLADKAIHLDVGALVPFARWVTPTAEPRRFDARFFLCALPPGQVGEIDDHEATSGLWATPREVLAKFMRGELQLAPPTTRCLEILSDARDIASAIAIAERQTLATICPLFVPDSPPFLALPGDPTHEIGARAVDGPTRFVLIDGRFVGRDP